MKIKVMNVLDKTRDLYNKLYELRLLSDNNEVSDIVFSNEFVEDHILIRMLTKCEWGEFTTRYDNCI